MHSSSVISVETLYQEYHPKVQAYVRSKIQNPHEAEDLVSAIFLKIVQKLNSYDPSKAALSTWIYTITRNTVTDYFRSHRRTLEFSDWLNHAEFPEEDPDEALDVLADALMTLKERERDLIVLHYYRGYTLKVVAEMMQMSYINAKVVHKNALKQLQKFYEK